MAKGVKTPKTYDTSFNFGANAPKAKKPKSSKPPKSQTNNNPHGGPSY